MDIWNLDIKKTYMNRDTDTKNYGSIYRDMDVPFLQKNEYPITLYFLL